MTGTTVVGAEMLDGLTLDRGWRVVGRIAPAAAATGGNFSIGYVVQNLDGRRGFCKALNFAEAMFAPDPVAVLQQLTESYMFERDLMQKCQERRMSRVVLAIDDGVGGFSP